MSQQTWEELIKKKPWKKWCKRCIYACTDGQLSCLAHDLRGECCLQKDGSDIRGDFHKRKCLLFVDKTKKK